VSHEREAQRHHEEPASESLPVASAPAVPPAPPAAFHAVSEHDAVVEESEAHRPVRRRRQGAGTEAGESSSLQMVETQAPVTSAPAVGDELRRRTKPRRRRSGAKQDEPLQMVETQPGTDSRTDGTPAQ